MPVFVFVISEHHNQEYNEFLTDHNEKIAIQVENIRWLPVLNFMIIIIVPIRCDQFKNSLYLII
jgi:hypothetical protein